MEKNKDLEWIKKNYSETLMKICRENFSTLLETPGLLPQVLESKFAHSAILGKVIEYQEAEDDFKSYIFSFVDVEKKIPKRQLEKSPEELLDEAGYILYPECKTEQDIQNFRHYYNREGETPKYIEGQPPEYRSGEELCTFNGGRLSTCRVWFAVKKNVDEIKRENFENPKREDEYGRSVISIQFSKGNVATLSIKNRYNHTVNNPDATFSNNLDNIISGLTEAFCKKYDLNLVDSGFIFDINDLVIGDDGKWYYSYFEENNIQFCENNVIIDNGHVIKLDKQFQLFGKYIIDSTKKTITRYPQDQFFIIGDSFLDSIGNIKAVEISKIKENEKQHPSEYKKITLKIEGGKDVVLTMNNINMPISVSNHNVTEIGDDFINVVNYDLPNVTKIGDKFAYEEDMFSIFGTQNVNLPKLKECGSDCFTSCENLENISLPELEICGDACFSYCENLKNLNLPKLKHCGDFCFVICDNLNILYLPNLETVRSNCFSACYNLETISCPKLTKCDSGCFEDCRSLTNVEVPPNVQFGNYCFMQSGKIASKMQELSRTENENINTK